MMKYIKYAFIFDPAKTWDDQNAFESDLSALFKERGLVAENIETVEGQEKIPTIIITPAPTPIEESPKLTIKR